MAVLIRRRDLDTALMGVFSDMFTTCLEGLLHEKWCSLQEQYRSGGSSAERSCFPSLGLVLVTNNESEFSRVAGLRLENWV